MIKLDNLNFKYKDNVILDNFNLEINKGEFVAIQGNNGSGKTTIALILAGLLKDYDGTYLINNQEPSNELIRNKIGIIFQNPDNQLVSSIVKNDIAFGLENRKIDPKKMDDIIDDVLNKLNIYHLKNYPITTLSGGEKQKVALAGIMVMNFDILIFDEATSMLDPDSSKEILKYMLDLHKEGKTIIMITHKSNEVKIANRIIKI